MNALEPMRTRLVEWLVAAAYPLWSRNGIDSRNGGFVEALDRNGLPLAQPRRARIHPRQIYAFAQARAFGWQGDVTGIVRRGMDYFTACYRRPDGFFRTLADADGRALDGRALLYDQAFALLGFAAAAVALDAPREFERRALELRDLIIARLGTDDGSYRSAEENTRHRESNPHMHLLEAFLAWAEIGHDAGWAAGVRALSDLALTRFIRKDTGALGESYLATWRPTPGIAGRVIEPGHQFEWAWLLLRCERWHASPLRDAALRLIGIGARFGVRNEIAVNALHDDFTVSDANGRFWPQCERLKAALIAATATGEQQYWSMAEAAAASLFAYLDTPVAGLWLDEKLASGEFAVSPAPASTLYHVVGAIAALDTALRDSL
jgi:mannose/cellobiose epimerase-like protein (N-acyl-D-glucosamine 2-epimerase family)